MFTGRHHLQVTTGALNEIADSESSQHSVIVSGQGWKKPSPGVDEVESAGLGKGNIEGVEGTVAKGKLDGSSLRK
ncbi:hypothetical protein TSUD_286250 [Trifolium subterraneum]|uniref:Uncharacterized protein n=1 Tax=Trifolium subterraneum TaxID=3900 RepID=A0A2Z6NUI2_TRISU|nr:hypothetical protein TSUD_286250 [Trifolium subterraneum]